MGKKRGRARTRWEKDMQDVLGLKLTKAVRIFDKRKELHMAVGAVTSLL